jgi:hypothetical protein
MANLYDKAQYIFVAGANKSGSIYGMSPIAGTTSVTLVSASTFRAGSGSRTNSSGFFENVGAGIARVDYSDVVTCPSYKFEPSRTNHVLSSLYLTSGTQPNGFALPNSGSWSLVSEPTSPVGTGFSGLLRENVTTTNSNFYLRNLLSGASNTGSYTFSVCVKRSGSGADARNLMINAGATAIGNAGVYFILDGTGSIFNPTAKVFVSGAFIEPLVNGWYRCSVLYSFDARTGGAPPAPAFYMTSGSTYTEGYRGNGTAALYVCAAQAESGSTSHGLRSTASYAAGTYVTSYISSSTAAVGTRNADRTVTLPSSSNSSAWTSFMAFKRYNQDVTSSYSMYITGSNGFIGIYQNGVAVWNSGSTILTSGSSLPIGVEHKAAVRYDSGTVTWFINGSQRFSITWPTSTFNGNVILGGNASDIDIPAGSSFYVRTAATFNQSLSNTECTSLTTTGSGTV